MIDFRDYIGDSSDLLKRYFIITREKEYIKGIPVLPNSTVNIFIEPLLGNYPRVSINEMNTERLIRYFKPFIRVKGNYCYMEQDTDCPNALLEWPKYANNITLLWHRDHFDEWDVDFDSIIDRIENEEEINISHGLTISSVFYSFDYQNAVLLDYIITKPFTYKTDTYTLELPPYIEIDHKLDGRISLIVPVKEWHYHKAFFGKNELLLIYEDGSISGHSARSFEINGLRFEEGVPLLVKPNGTTSTYYYEPNKNGKLGNKKIFFL